MEREGVGEVNGEVDGGGGRKWSEVDREGGRGGGRRREGERKGGREGAVCLRLTIPLQCSQTDVPMKVCSTKLCVNLSLRRKLNDSMLHPQFQCPG